MSEHPSCVALRRLEGTLDPLVRKKVIKAKRILIDVVGLGANAIYLMELNGDMIWPLRLGCLAEAGLLSSASGLNRTVPSQ